MPLKGINRFNSQLSWSDEKSLLLKAQNFSVHIFLLYRQRSIWIKFLLGLWLHC